MTSSRKVLYSAVLAIQTITAITRTAHGDLIAQDVSRSCLQGAGVVGGIVMVKVVVSSEEVG